ncbi:MAG: response regulator [Gammaproteobacteria bacterium]|nr:response regulator [Gammaproteobacteria bacterium]
MIMIKFRFETRLKILFALLLPVGLYVTSLYNGLLFHTLAEGLSIVVAGMLFFIVWNSRRFVENRYLLFLGIGYFFIAGIDLVHTLAYKKMNIFPGYDTNLSTQLWIAARYMESLTLLAAPLFLHRTLNARVMFGGGTILFTLLLAAIFGGFFPVCFIEGKGLTAFKINSEHLISLLLLGALFLLLRCRAAFDARIMWLMLISIALTICAELAFTFYTKIHGLSNLFGHYFKLLSFYCIYRAIIETGLNDPYTLLFSELKQNEDALRQARQMAERAKEEADAANRAKSEFLTCMNHEIRTPMNAVIGFTGLALQTELTAKQRNYLDKVKTSSYSLLNLLNDILDCSKVKAGKLDIECVNFQLEDIIHKLSEPLRLAAADKGLEFATLIAPNVPCALKGDPLRLRQVLTNLTDNAVKFTEKGKVILHAALAEGSRETDSKRVKLRFSVLDTGIGLTPEQIPKLFRSFSQADGSITRKFGGMGLGLALSKQLAELMGGTIDVESEADKGSTFWFTAEFARQTARQRFLFYPPRELRGIKVLAVDNNEYSRDILGRMLRSFSFVPVLAASGEEAVLAAEQGFALVIMDWQLSAMDSIESAMKIIRENRGAAPPPKIIVLTAFDREEIRLQTAKIPIDAFLVKPVTQSTLFDTIMDVFGRETEKLPADKKTESVPQPDIPQEIRGARVLLAEDNPINLQLATEILKQAGIHVAVADNGKKALAELAENGAFDAVLMDIQMPKMDGYEATRLIKNNPCYAKLPVIAMTAYTLKGDKEKCLAAGMDDYIAKPIAVDRLLAVLSKWIKPGKRLPVPSRAKIEETPESNLPDKLPGIDIAAGLKRLGGDKHLFKKFLMDFRRDNTGTLQTIRGALDNDDQTLALHLTHALKGLAGNLSMTSLSDTAKSLETAVRQGEKASFAGLLEETEQCLNEVLQAVAMLKPDESPLTDAKKSALSIAEKDATPPDTALLAPLLKELDSLLKQHNMKAGKHCRKVKKHLSASTWQNDMAQMEDFINNLKYKDARNSLAKLAGRLSISL